MMVQEDATKMNNGQAMQILKSLRVMMIDWNGCPSSDAVFALDKAIKALEQLEIIRCKDCYHHHYEHEIPYCDRINYGYGWKDDDFCSRAERREDG